MEVKNWTYEDLPEFDQEIEGAKYIETTGDEQGMVYLHDVEYATVHGVTLHLQIIIPNSRNHSFFGGPQNLVKRPCFVFVQGSGWGKQYVYGNVPQLGRIAERGYVCAIVEYRHSDIAYFPAQVKDTRNAIRFLRKNADKFGIDPERMILAGDSSGGHTAVWAGMLHDDDASDNLFPGISAEVKGIVDYYGSTSLIAKDSNPCTINHCLPDSPEGKVMGGANLIEHPELARALSAECNIYPGMDIAPILIFHGTKDRVVNCTGSAKLYQRLTHTRHEAECYFVKGADHGGAEFWTKEIIDIVDDFCQRCFERKEEC